MNQQRKGDWIQTFTGKAFYPFDPRPEDICIQDIAHALSNLCRWGGHCSRFYSVAEHSVLVSREVQKAMTNASSLSQSYMCLTALMHDATEAYLIDLPRPIKQNIKQYREVEANLATVIARRFGLYSHPITLKAIHDADNAVLFAERNQLMRATPRSWGWDVEPADVTINGFNPQFAKTWFLAEFKNLATRCKLDVSTF